MYGIDTKTLGVLAVALVLGATVATPLATVSTAVSAAHAADAAQSAADAAQSAADSAKRSPDALEALAALRASAPGALASPGFLQDFTVSCGTSVTDVRPSSGSATSIACTCVGAVSWGGPAVTTSDYSKADFAANVRFATCIAGSATSCACVAVTTGP